MYAVVVTFQLTPGSEDEFLPLVRENALASLKNEEGCHRFDIALNPEYKSEVFLYELYTDAEAFAAHLKTRHFAAFDAQSAPMIASKEVKFYREVIQ